MQPFSEQSRAHPLSSLTDYKGRKSADFIFLSCFFTFSPPLFIFCLQSCSGGYRHATGVGGGRRDRGRKEGEGINRTEAGNDELKEQPLIFHFDRLSSVRRQQRWLLCPERRHLLFVMLASLFIFLSFFLLELGSGHPKNKKCMTIYNLHARR